MNKYHLHPSQILGFHSCDKKVGLKVLNGKEGLTPSENKWDWLGHGIYFWEHNPFRALQYAQDVASGSQKAKAKIETPFVIGCIIDLGLCLSLTEPSNFSLLKGSFNSLKSTFEKDNLAMPKNIDNSRILDCAVFMQLHKLLELRNWPPYDTIRGAFPEGKPIYNGCAISNQTHIQICVRNPKAILGYFLPLPIKQVNPNL